MLYFFIKDCMIEKTSVSKENSKNHSNCKLFLEYFAFLWFLWPLLVFFSCVFHTSLSSLINCIYRDLFYCFSWKLHGRTDFNHYSHRFLCFLSLVIITHGPNWKKIKNYYFTWFFNNSIYSSVQKEKEAQVFSQVIKTSWLNLTDEFSTFACLL